MNGLRLGLAVSALLIAAGCGGGAEAPRQEPSASATPTGLSWKGVCPEVFDIWGTERAGMDDADYYKAAADSVQLLIDEAGNDVMPFLIGLRDKAQDASMAYLGTDPREWAKGLTGWYEANGDIGKACRQAGVPLGG